MEMRVVDNILTSIKANKNPKEQQQKQQQQRQQTPNIQTIACKLSEN